MLDIIFDLNTISTVGQHVATLLDVKLPLLLYGEMGSGKTTLTKQIAKALGVTDDVTSPTFNIMQSYKAGKQTFWHIDLYRLEGKSNIEELGLDELNYQNLLIIEWPQYLERLFNPHIKGILKVLANGQRHLILEKIHE